MRTPYVGCGSYSRTSGQAGVVSKKAEKAPTPSKKTSSASKAPTTAQKQASGKPVIKPRCGSCGHWSIATEYGVDDRSGYCDRWEKLTDRDYVCDEYVSREKFQAMQQELAEQHEEYLDEDTG